MTTLNPRSVAREWSISGGRASFWLACGALVSLLFGIAPPSIAAVLALFASALGGAALLGRGRKGGTSNPVLGGCGLVLGLLTGAFCLLLLPARMAIDENARRNGGETRRATSDSPGPAAVTCANGTLTLHSPGDTWRMFPKGAGEFGDTCDGHAVHIDPDDGSKFVGLVISQPFEEEAIRRNGLTTMADSFMKSFKAFDSRANESVDDATLGGQPGAVCEFTGVMDGKPMRLRQILVYWRGNLSQVRMVGDDAPSFAAMADRFADAVEFVAETEQGSPAR